MDKLEKKVLIKGKIVALTGLQIGGSSSAMSIGGPDKIVIRNPVNNEPYIPGSSLKGKMRSLAEISRGYIKDVNIGKVTFGPDDDPTNVTTLLFGNSRGDENQRPSRIIVRDGKLLNPDKLEKTDLPFTESKTEVVIDRITSQAVPRQFERVPAGAEFNLELVVNIFKDDRMSEDLLPLTFKCLELVQDDYLGGSGSRGSGQVKFIIEEVKERPSAYYQGDRASEKIITTSCNLPDNLK